MRAMSMQAQAELGVRLVGLLVAAGALWSLGGNLLAGLGGYDPAHFWHFARMELAQPAAGLAVAGVLLGAARPIGRALSGGQQDGTDRKDGE